MWNSILSENSDICWGSRNIHCGEEDYYTQEEKSRQGKMTSRVPLVPFSGYKIKYGRQTDIDSNPNSATLQPVRFVDHYI